MGAERTRHGRRAASRGTPRHRCPHLAPIVRHTGHGVDVAEAEPRPWVLRWRSGRRVVERCVPYALGVTLLQHPRLVRVWSHGGGFCDPWLLPHEDSRGAGAA